MCESLAMARSSNRPRSARTASRSKPISSSIHSRAQTDPDLFRTLAEASIDVICLIGRDNRAKYFSPSVTQLLGWTPDELVGVTADFLIVSEDLHVIADATEQHMSGHTDVSTLTYRVRRRDGSVAWVEATAKTIVDPADGTPGDTVAVLRDISERKAKEEALSALALLEPLTGLANRRALDQVLDQEWRRGAEGSGPLSLLLLDLDHFKSFNDLYGHQVGDRCLQAIAGVLRAATTEPPDLVARYGGEEFIILLPATSDKAAAVRAEQVRFAIEMLRIPHAGRPDGYPWITASVGTATVEFPHLSPAAIVGDLFNVADEALYRAKSLGRNCVARGWLALPQAAALLHGPTKVRGQPT